MLSRDLNRRTEPKNNQGREFLTKLNFLLKDKINKKIKEKELSIFNGK